MLYFSKLKKEDLSKYALLTRGELPAEEYLAPELLLNEWGDIDSYILMNSDKEWIGWCAISSKGSVCNPDGTEFLCGVVFPQYRNQGYLKYLYKIYFDKSIGKPKLIAINFYHDKLINLSERYGFRPHQTNRIWNTYFCEKDMYPEEIRDLKLKELA
ncbi:MAG: hypothetical protein LBR70_03905 [Lactobacillaceae bacterium]|jgi:hypothetical protein|nr:hypothetical protein [Lactobacillaceae bacterium]